MKKVITLSSLVTSRPIASKNPAEDWVVYDFADLHKYQKSCFSSCPTVFETPSYYLASVTNTFFKFPLALKIAHKFWQSEHTLVHDYKIGVLQSFRESQTERFTQEMLSHFSFLLSERTSSIPENVKMSLWNQRHRYIAIKDLKDINEFTHRKVAEALVQKAWCSQVSITEENWLKIDYLVKSGDQIIFECDSNPLHGHYLLSLFKERYPTLEWNLHSDEQLADNIQLSEMKKIVEMSDKDFIGNYAKATDKDDDKVSSEEEAEEDLTPIELPKQLTSNLFWASSYHYHSYSSEYNNKKFKVKAPSITASLVDMFGADNLEFISHFDFNRQEAQNLGVRSKRPEEFFPLNLLISEGESTKKTL